MSSSPLEQPSSSPHRGHTSLTEDEGGSRRMHGIGSESEDRHSRDARSGRHLRERNTERSDTSQETRGLVDYVVHAQVYEVIASLQPPLSSPPPHQHQQRHTSNAYTQPGLAAGSNTTSYRQTPSLRQPSGFSIQDQAYLRGRLPSGQRVSARTVTNHFRRLPFLYQDLAEGCRAHVSHLPPEARELEKRRRMAGLAQRLADKYMRFKLILPRSYVDEAIARLQGELPRTNRFWEKTLEEIERANSSWSVARLWILLFMLQSSLVTVAYSILPTPGKIALLIANCFALVWSTTVMCEMPHARYIEVKSDEQELHDLLGGLRG